MPVSCNPGDDGVVQSSAGAATDNHTGTFITTEALTTAAGADYTFTLTNQNIGPTSCLSVQVGNGTNTTTPYYVHSVQPYAGGVSFSIHNAHATAPFNGSLIIMVIAL